jgi:lipoprotein-releasing system ATP-binding protein
MSRESPEPILRCAGVGKSFGPPSRRVEVLRGLDLAVTRGEMVAVLGESGTGKTTLLHLVGAIDRPDSGVILFRGRDIGAAPPQERAVYRNRDLGFVFQLHHLLPEFSAVENAMMPLLIRGEDRGKARDRSLALLQELGLKDCADRRPSELSGGEQQRVAIARAIAGSPALLLADEPTGNLDERNAEVVFGLLSELHRRRGMTTLFVTHSARLAEKCSRILKMEHGSLTDPAGTRYNVEASTTQAPR